MVYDDACHLARFVQNRKEHSKRIDLFSQKLFAVDKLHFQSFVFE
jgi:hypothetical protein